MRSNDWIAEGRRLAYRLGLATPEFRTLECFYLHNRLSPTQMGRFEREVAKVHAYARSRPALSLFDTPITHSGELHVGTLPNGSPFCLRLAQLAQGTLLVGAIGSGKTTLLRALVVEIFRHLRSSGGDGGVWLVDHQKTELETVLPLAEEFGLHVAIATPDLPINPLEPPVGVPPMTWKGNVLSLLASALQLTPIAELSLRPLLHALYLKDPCPTWRDLIRAVTAAEMLEATRRPILLRLEGIATDLPSVANTKHGVPVHELENRVIYFPLQGWPQDHARLLFGTVCWAAFARRREERRPHPVPNLFKVEDEISFGYPTVGGLDHVSMLCAVQRSLGICFVGANQRFSGLLPQISSNCTTKIVSRLGDMQDINAACDILTLSTKEQQEYLTRELECGQFITRLPSGHLAPFCFTGLNVPGVPLSEQARRSAEDLLFRQLNIQPAREVSAEAELQVVAESAAHNDVASPSKKSETLPTDEELVLKSCLAQHFLFHTERREACSLNNSRFNEAKKSLIAKELVHEHVLETLKAGARRKLLEITASGCAAINQTAPAWHGRAGGFLSHYGKELARSFYLSKGYKVELEKPLGNGMAVDVLAVSEDESVAVEVQTTTDHALENVSKVKDVVDRVEVLTFSGPIQAQLKRILGATIRVCHFSFYANDFRHFQSGKTSSSPPSDGGDE